MPHLHENISVEGCQILSAGRNLEGPMYNACLDAPAVEVPKKHGNIAEKSATIATVNSHVPLQLTIHEGRLNTAWHHKGKAIDPWYQFRFVPLVIAVVATGAATVGRLSLDVVGGKVCVGAVEVVELVRVVALTVVIVVVVLTVLVESRSLAASNIFAATVSKKQGLRVVVWQPPPAKTFNNCLGNKTTS
eukprot:CAMPEP_0172803932 /NCGR_PEP_ID=MMETSP1075-20121228/4827_1 /TAXON_ID=2916 /ORGANISM="Ceratium fusus, Strain PA161109" /LENGTH=189 /DNA_ID=CAMNT_0013642433 /DNA_START=581 /DNA_END=1151 /DNA_ORIENTATION=-